MCQDCQGLNLGTEHELIHALIKLLQLGKQADWYGLVDYLSDRRGPEMYHNIQRDPALHLSTARETVYILVSTLIVQSINSSPTSSSNFLHTGFSFPFTETMRFLTLLSISSAVALVAAECCGSGGNCNGYGPCNIFCCNCDWRYRIDLRPGAGRVCRKYGKLECSALF